MNTTKEEKEWLRRISGCMHINNDDQPKQATNSGTAKVGVKSTAENKSIKGNGFKDIAGMDELKDFVTKGFINVLLYREHAALYEIKPPSMLFYGPSGCGKTYFAEKMAEEVGINFMKIVPDDLACTWIHGTQQKIGEVFRKAEKNAPTILFFDEFDAMVSQRSGDEANQHYDSEVNEFLCMLNNAAERGVYVLAATNHPERIDKAVLRTGRIDELVYIEMPDKEARKSLFDLNLSKLPVSEDVDTDRLATLTDGYNCSDISYIVKSAAREMFNATISSDVSELLKISQSLLENIISKRSPSVSYKDLREYERVREKFAPNDKQRKTIAIGYR